MKTTLLAIVATFAIGAPRLDAQVAINPLNTTPAAWEKFGLRVFNQTDTPTVAVRLDVPAAMMVLGVANEPGWTFEVTQGQDSAPAVIRWKGGQIRRGEYVEFSFLGRLKADSRQEDLVFGAAIDRASGSTVEWRAPEGQDYAAPRVRVAGTVRVSGAGTMVMAGLGIGLAMVALVIALARGGPKRTA